MTADSSSLAGLATRGASRTGYHLLCPENRAPSELPGLPGVIVYKLVSPRRAAAQFAAYLLELPEGSGSRGQAMPADPLVESFVYVLTGTATIDIADQGARRLRADGFAYLAPGELLRLRNDEPSTTHCLVFRRRYDPAPGLEAPESFIGCRSDAGVRVMQPGLRRTELLPVDDPRHDFTVYVMSFEPGAGLGMVEIHDEEHGLWMHAGGGLYRLGAEEHTVGAGDFIYMAPYCPQAFSADPKTGGEYILYKDCFRETI